MNRVLLFAVICISPVSGQTLDLAFDVMLRSLLSHSVPIVNSEALDTMRHAVLLDAREKQEYRVSHIAGARWVGYDDFDWERVAGIDKTARVVVYCSVGFRSERIAEKLRRAGFHHAVNLYGGIFDWVNRGRNVVDSTGTTRRIHPYDETWGVWLKRGEKVYGD